ncbi:MAG: ABC-2 type transporter [Ignavibacteriae bacterium]|nr:MAG: ABC-2 type transporter [Ignavibacteriota bacterium]
MPGKFNIIPIVKKELKQIGRDKRTLAIMLLAPAFLLVMVGYALNFDVKHIKILFYDEDKTQESSNFIKYFSHTEYFIVYKQIDNITDADKYLEKGEVLVLISINRDFSKNLLSGKEAVVQVIIDGSNANTASNALGYINAAIQSYSTKILSQTILKQGVNFRIPIEIRNRFWYNPDLKSSRYLIPGLFGMILMIVGVVSTSMSLVREKEQGTIEQIIVSPLKSYEIIIGKSLPYLAISLVASTLVLIMSAILFNITIQGSILLFYLATMLFLMGALGQGLLISSIAKTQAIAFLISVLSSLLPTFLLSGFIFPIKNMPIWLQIITHIVPAKYYLVALRCVMIKGTGIEAFWEQLVFLFLFCILTLGISIFMTRKELEK